MTDEQTIRAALSDPLIAYPGDALAALDRLVAERDAEVNTWKRITDDMTEKADAALSRAEAAEEGLQHVRDVIASYPHSDDDAYVAAEVESALRLLTARCATLEAALREIAEQKWVARPEGPRPAWCSEQSPFWNFLTPEEIARAALAAATPPAEKEGT